MGPIFCTQLFPSGYLLILKKKVEPEGGGYKVLQNENSKRQTNQWILSHRAKENKNKNASQKGQRSLDIDKREA